MLYDYKNYDEYQEYSDEEMIKRKENTLKNNKLIAEFMGYYFRDNFKGRSMFWHSSDSKIWGKGTWTPAFTLNTSDFNCSWEWLMPVIEKIEAINDKHHGYFQVHLSSNTCSIQGTNLWKSLQENSTYGSVYISDPNAIFPTKLESTYYTIIKFIEWYNENLKK